MCTCVLVLFCLLVVTVYHVTSALYLNLYQCWYVCSSPAPLVLVVFFLVTPTAQLHLPCCGYYRSNQIAPTTYLQDQDETDRKHRKSSSLTGNPPFPCSSSTHSREVMAEQNGLAYSQRTYDSARKARITSENFYDNLLVHYRDRSNR